MVSGESAVRGALRGPPPPALTAGGQGQPPVQACHRQHGAANHRIIYSNKIFIIDMTQLIVKPSTDARCVKDNSPASFLKAVLKLVLHDEVYGACIHALHAMEAAHQVLRNNQRLAKAADCQ
jgi:hypothetical protein